MPHRCGAVKQKLCRGGSAYPLLDKGERTRCGFRKGTPMEQCGRRAAAAYQGWGRSELTPLPCWSVRHDKGARASATK
jgi:hypothetical protein